MIHAKLDDEPLELEWFKFSMKIAAAAVWLISSGVASEVIASPEIEGWKRAAAGIVLVVPAFAWLQLLARKIKHSDEFNRNLLLIGLRSGNSWAVLFGPLCIGVIAIVSTLPHGQAALPHGPTDLMRAGYLVLFFQPPLAFLYGALMAQYARWAYCRKERT